MFDWILCLANKSLKLFESLFSVNTQTQDFILCQFLDFLLAVETFSKHFMLNSRI